MLYICVPSHNEQKTVGLLLWKIRRVFSDFKREYQLIVADDGASDDTAEILEQYQHALPMTVVHHDTHQGYAATIEELLRTALRLTDRPKRDCAITIGADFSVSPAALPDLVKRFESGADVVIGESIGSESGAGRRLVRRAAGQLLRPGLQVPGVQDLLSGVCVIRLLTLKRMFGNRSEAVLTGPANSARAELIARAAAEARQIAAFQLAPKDLRPEASHSQPGTLALAVDLFKAGRMLNIPRPAASVQRVS